MSKYSTIVEFNKQTESAIDYLISISTSDSMITVLSTIKRLGSLSNEVTLNDVMTNTGMSKTSVRENFIRLKKSGSVSTKSARSLYPDAPSRLEIYTFRPIAEQPSELDNQADRNFVGRQSVAAIEQNLNDHQVYTPASYRDEFVSNPNNYQMSISEQVSNLIAPADQIIARKEQIVTATDGRRITNFAFSQFGIINDFDSIIINSLGKATVAYINTLPEHRQMDLDGNSRIPLWVDDLIKRHANFDHTYDRKKICLSLIRIRYTMYKYLREAKTDRDKDLVKQFGHEITDDFNFLTSLTIISQKSNSSFSESDFFDEEGSPLSNVNRDFGQEIPFSAFYITWHPEFYKRNFTKGKLFVINDAFNRIPPTFYRLYKELRQDYYKRHFARLIKEEGVPYTLSILELAKFTWRNEKSETDYHNLVASMLIDLKKMIKRFDEIVTCTENDDGSSEVTVKLYGFYLEFVVPNIKLHSRKFNLSGTVRVFVNEQVLITESGAKFNPTISNNTPTLPNPISSIVQANQLDDQDYQVRRYLPDVARKFKSKLKDFKVGKFTIQFTYKKESFLLSNYSSQEELDDIYLRLAEQTGAPLEVVDLVFETSMKNIQDFPQISWQKMNQLVEVLEIPKSEIIRFLIMRVKGIDRYLSMGPKELKELIEANLE